ncbi:hypothetical protein [Catellatospora chokoriensis]|uniref:Uncharacterized protein n=1 Tax=Catellatospora chokoriensis TaxID=310353 RepID=A0A8J3NX74_9ACTN|nr:hypothetical protein [Catellatospora chokoriensis]GIF94025.1 hypothetical protein Cch02nite_74690 [Catellatospora chokoriensis]
MNPMPPPPAQTRPPLSGDVVLWSLSPQERQRLLYVLQRAAERPLSGGRATAAALAARLSAVPVLQAPQLYFDADACRAWLDHGAAARYGIDDGLRRDSLTGTAGLLEDLLAALNDGEAPHLWRPQGGLRHVRIWRTADNDGADGGVLLAVDVRIGDAAARICPLRLDPDDLITADNAGISAAVQAVAAIASAVNRECDAFYQGLAGTNGSRS